MRYPYRATFKIKLAVIRTRFVPFLVSSDSLYLLYSTQRRNAHVAEHFLKVKKTGKVKHTYNKDKTRLIDLKR